MTALTNCRACGGMVAKSAPTCPHCGHVIKQQYGCGTGCGLLILVPLAIGIWGAALGGGSDPPKPVVANSETTAVAMCRTFVERQLKAPRTARFVFGSQGVSRVDSVTYQVSGEVDAENSFGAMLRNRYTCRLRYHPGLDSWEPVRVSVD